MSEATAFWRIAADTPSYEATDLSGKGAEASGGRWNRRGTPLLYASGSRALACLETLVHLGNSLPLNRYLVELTVPAAALQAAVTFDAQDHVGWDAEPAGRVSLDWGTAWATSRRSLLAWVPSVVVPEEWNLLINPLHPDMANLAAAKTRKWLYDPRLAGAA